MARLHKGIMGPLTGKLGNIVGSSWKKTYYIKPAPKKSTKPKSEAMLQNQAKFSFFSHFLKPFKPYFQVGFKAKATYKSELNISYSENYKRALTGSFPNFEIDYAAFVFSLGKLPGLRSVSMRRNSDNELMLSWDGNNFNINSRYDDQLILLIYAPNLGKVDGVIKGIRRTTEQHTFFMAEEFRTQPIEVYVAVAAFEGKKVSDSQYVGRMEPV